MDKIFKKIYHIQEDNKKDKLILNFLNKEIDQEIENKVIKKNKKIKKNKIIKEIKENKNIRMHKN